MSGSAAEHIVIKGLGAISPLGHDEKTTLQSYREGIAAICPTTHQGLATPVARLSLEAEEKLQQLIASNASYRHVDRSVLMAIHAARQAAEQAGWLSETQPAPDNDLAINIGSSRGATGLFEQHYQAFQSEHLSASASPTTTLGNLSSWVAHSVNAGGAQVSHSITCSTALMAVANATAWLRAGMASRFLAGGTEAPLTDFTIAQMKAIGIYSTLAGHAFPCQPYGTLGQNTFVLGEGAAVLALEKTSALQKGDVIVEAVGHGFETIASKTGISPEGLNFQKSMRHALAQLHDSADSRVDAIISHSPGTKAGDRAELNAIVSVFGKQHPFISTNKWMLGHTLGASGALSLQYALSLFQQPPTPQPYENILKQSSPASITRVMVNAAGFGGNAATVILKLIA